MTVHIANRKHLHVGDLVIHDRDEKRHDLIRVVVARMNDGTLRTVYQFKNELPAHWRNRVFYDRPSHLLDPRRFGICRTRRPNTAKAGAGSGEVASVAA